MPNPIDRTTIALGDLSKAVAIAFLALAAAIAGPPPAMAADDDGGIRLVTQNMYVGSSFAALSAAQTPQQLLAAVALIYNNIVASKPAERAAAMAREIARHRPDLVALQEAAILRTGTGGARPRRCDRISCNRCSMSSPAWGSATVRWRSFRGLMPRRRARSGSTSASPTRMPFWCGAICWAVRSRCRTCRSSNSGSSSHRRPWSVPFTDPRGWAAIDVKLRGSASAS